MNQIISELLSSLMQLAISCLIPFIFFLFRKNKEVGFLKYIGLYGASAKSILYVLAAAFVILSTTIGLAHVSEGMRKMMFDPHSVTGKLRLMGLTGETFLILLMIAWIKTSLSEEIFFRGFLAARLNSKFGFKAGNISQALIFGGIHFLLFSQTTSTGIGSLILIFFLTTTAALLIGYIKEKLANGSIIPGWIAHGLGNTLAYLIVAFVM